MLTPSRSRRVLAYQRNRSAGDVSSSRRAGWILGG